MSKHAGKIQSIERSSQGPVYRFLGRISPAENQRTPVQNSLGSNTSGEVPVLRIYDPIDSWGEFWGVSAKEVVAALDEIGEVDRIEVRLNSPGGEATEGVAIYNALVSHPAQIDIVVDGLAASAASIIAMAGDTITMMKGTQMMIHDAWGICIGNADDMKKMDDLLSHMSSTLAAVYADRAGGTVAEWRDAMKEETWYSPEEAVKAGLATTVTKKKTESDDPAKSQARFDLSVFNHAGRANAPAPVLDTKTRNSHGTVSNSSKKSQETHRMTEDQLKSIGLPKDATDAQISARLGELVKNETNPDEVTPEEDPKTGEDDPENGGEDQPGKPATPQAPPTDPAAPAAPETVTLDKAQYENLMASTQKNTAELAAIKVNQAKEERDNYLKAAMRDGKFAPAQKADYEAFWNADPKGAKKMIDGLAKNTVPVAPLGRADENETLDEDAYPAQFLTETEKANIRNARSLQEA